MSSHRKTEGALRSHAPSHFDALFSENDDPWLFRSRWYEARKRALTLACLPQERFTSGFEPGCANGELSASLASRCDQLLVCDGAAGAVALAKRRTLSFKNVRVQQAWIPDDWPEETFDLVVISELGYFLSTHALGELVAKTRLCLRPGGTVLACHWRRFSADCVMSGDDVHHCIGEGLALPHLSELVEADFRIDVWSDNPLSIAQREGIV